MLAGLGPLLGLGGEEAVGEDSSAGEEEAEGGEEGERFDMELPGRHAYLGEGREVRAVNDLLS